MGIVIIDVGADSDLKRIDGDCDQQYLQITHIKTDRLLRP